ncbi:hypothetical protein Ahia01_000597900 [Argonauta hians]
MEKVDPWNTKPGTVNSDDQAGKNEYNTSQQGKHVVVVQTQNDYSDQGQASCSLRYRPNHWHVHEKAECDCKKTYGRDDPREDRETIVETKTDR